MKRRFFFLLLSVALIFSLCLSSFAYQTTDTLPENLLPIKDGFYNSNLNLSYLPSSSYFYQILDDIHNPSKAVFATFSVKGSLSLYPVYFCFFSCDKNSMSLDYSGSNFSLSSSSLCYYRVYKGTSQMPYQFYNDLILDSEKGIDLSAVYGLNDFFTLVPLSEDFPMFKIPDTPKLRVYTGSIPLRIRTPAGIHTVTVNLQYEDGSNAGEPIVKSYEYSEKYSISAPSIFSHTPDKTEVSGIMGKENIEATITYKQRSNPFEFVIPPESFSPLVSGFIDSVKIVFVAAASIFTALLGSRLIIWLFSLFFHKK